MLFRLRALVATAAAAAVFIGAAPHRSQLTVYGSPSGARVAGSSAQHPTDAILPDGRIASPVGDSMFVGTNPQGVALSPNGDFAVVADADGSEDVGPTPSPQLVAGSALVVVDARTMRISDVYHAPSASFSGGVAVVADPKNSAQTLVLAADPAHDMVRVFDLSFDGHLTAESPIALPVAALPGYAADRRAGPTALAVSPSGRTAYVAESAGDIVAAIDLTKRSALGGVPVGFDPSAVAAASDRAYAVNAGLSTYRVLAAPARAPRFAVPDVDPNRASSLSVVAVDANGAPSGDASFVQMDPVPDGATTIGGTIPSAIALRADGRYAYVALSNVDRVATIDTSGTPRVTSGLDLRLFPNAPYGTQPSAEALAADGSRLYVALAGLNAVAVLDAHDPSQLHRLGLVPTGWYPSALALSGDGRYLYVAAAKGVAGWGILQRVDLRRLPLGPVTLSALRYNRTASFAKPNALVPPLRSLQRSNGIKHVVYLSVGIDDYDAVLGDLADASGKQHGNGLASYVLYGESVTPNLHALAREFALADNLYDADDATWPVARGANPEDPESYPRDGFIFNSLARARETFRDFGWMLQVSGYRNGAYSLDVPALAALAGNVDLAYAAWNPAITDDARAAEFVRDFGALAQQNAVPDFTYAWIPTPPGGEALADRALGRIVAAIAQSPAWSSTAIFVVPEAFQSRRDHVDGSRVYAIVVSPYSRRGFVDDTHLSVASVLKTEEEILGLPPLGTSDLLATDLAPCFTAVPDATPYAALP